MNPLMLLMALLMHGMQQRQQQGQQGPHGPLGGMATGQRPAGPTGNAPGGATLPFAGPQTASKGVPAQQGSQGTLQGYHGASGPFSGISSLLNAMGMYPHQMNATGMPTGNVGNSGPRGW